MSLITSCCTNQKSTRGVEKCRDHTGQQPPECSWWGLQVVQQLHRRPPRVPPLPVRAVLGGRPVQSARWRRQPTQQCMFCERNRLHICLGCRGKAEVKLELDSGSWRRSHPGTRTLRAALFCKHSVCSAWQMAGRRSCRFWNAAPSCATCALHSAVTNMNTTLEMHVNADQTLLPHVSVVVTMCLIFTQPQGLSQISTTFASSLTCKS
jgi:hypothetical protein